MRFYIKKNSETDKYNEIRSRFLLTHIILALGLIISVIFITFAFNTQTRIHSEKSAFTNLCFSYLQTSSEMTEHSRRIGVLEDYSSLEEYQQLYLDGGREATLVQLLDKAQNQAQQEIVSKLKSKAQDLTEREHKIIYLSSELREHENVLSLRVSNYENPDNRLLASTEPFYILAANDNFNVDIDLSELEGFTVETLFSNDYEETKHQEQSLINKLQTAYQQSKSRDLKYAERQGVISIALLTIITFLIPIIGVTDLRKKVKIREDLYKKKEHLDVTLRSIQEGVMSTDPYGRVMTLNKTGENILEIDKEKVAGKRIWEVLSIFYPNCKKPINLFTIHRGKGITSLNKQRHFKLKTLSGKTRNIVLKCSKLLNENGEQSQGYVVAFADITDQIKLEKEIMKNKKLESLGVLAGGLAHDFNNLLTIIKGNLSLASQGKPKTEHIKETEKALDTAQGLTYQLLTFSKGGSPVKETATLKELIVESASFILRGSSIKCVFDLNENICPVEIDRGQINAVLNNLLINAIQSMDNGGTIKITGNNTEITEESFIPLAEGKYVKISVIDEGVGISKEDLEKVFDPFFTTKKEGSGLGLPSSFSIIKNHGGHMIAESELGIGTTMSFYLPVTTKNLVGGVQKLPFEEEDITSTMTGRVLVMDDEPQIRRILEIILTNRGFDVEVVENGEQAVQEIASCTDNEDTYDLVIMDLTVRGAMGGKQAIEKIKKIDPTIKAIVSSGYSNDPVMARFKDYGFDGYVIKPFNADEVLAAISKALNKN
ncbi:response regulator [Proteinivorax hydrogeniformans]|uniref:Stage 0 sporulation protein A homolog n=1 Tax=Proteinivorax hydrogeniformans TaxID=1826727 RepID=A0AAU8HWR9_9FIRM